MGKKAYTILIFSQKAAGVKKFILSPLALKIGAAVLGLILAISAVIIYDYVVYKQKVAELKSLRAETEAQQEEIRSFQEKITFLEGQLDKIREMEKQVETDLKEVTELSKEKKNVTALPKKRAPNKIKKESALVREVIHPRGEIITVLAQEKSRLVSRLHLDLVELQKKAFQREQNLKDLSEFLQTQKSILLATPSLWPVIGRISSFFGETRASSSGGSRAHKGLDICAPSGTPIVASADGFVSFSGTEAEYGRLVCIDHGHGFSTAYGHLQKIHVQAGEKIQKGQIIGTVGLTGNSTGCHVHFEVRIQNNPVDPIRFLN